MEKEITKEQEIEEQKKESARRISIKEGASYSLMDGFGVRWVSAYGISMQLSNTYIGLLSTLPGLIANFGQLITNSLMKRFSRRKIVSLSVFLQALMWLPLILVGFLYFVLGISSTSAGVLLIAAYSILGFAGAIAGPAWTSWMKDIVGERSGIYFAKRNRIASLVALVCAFAAGFLLDIFEKFNAFYGFAIVFFIAFIGRSLSAFFFTKQYEPKFNYEENSYFSFSQFVKKMAFNNFGRFVLLVSLMSLATNFASPFFAAYILRDLHISYLSYTFITLSASISTLLFLPLWGRFSDKFGYIKTMRVTGFLIPLIPLFYLLTAFFPVYVFLIVPFLIVSEFLSGFAWAGFNLSAGNFVYDAVTRQRVAICVAYFNIINSLGAFLGSTLGGLLSSLVTPFITFNSLLVIFFLSFVLRLSVMLFISPIIKDVRPVSSFTMKDNILKKIRLDAFYFWEYLGFKNIRMK